MTDSRPYFIVLGNEKGGSGKSTTAMHVAIGLLRLGYRVGSIDLDARQGTFTRYMANRFEYVARHKLELPSPIHFPIERSKAATVDQQERMDYDFFMMATEEMSSLVDFVVVDTPGSDTYLGQIAHSYADTVITPMNDSFIDLDVLARIDTESRAIKGPSIYTKMVLEQRGKKKARDGKDLDWIVMRNRLSSLDAKNKREVGELLEEIGKQFGFRLAPGFGERVIFREMFLKGMTLLDMKEDPEHKMTMSAISARQEIRDLLRCIAPEQVKGYPQKVK
ncbi:MAG TPA: division plane positioning ATPase MipZ [Alphaproteobacteria bacterium]|nr:division plane positioning ATPase MipZ [Alphaproteobacteria bacterium]HNS45099.1 division plane positioning ATPase MipZ [Alphaproteobacteria bacterium]